jgi:hypothetical protein
MKARIITISPRGYVVEFETENGAEFRDLLKGLRPLETALNHAGYRPNGQIPKSPEGLPICQKHGEVMRLREKQGDEWFSHKVIDEHGEILYCKGRPGADSPGWDIADQATSLDDVEQIAAVASPAQPSQTPDATPAPTCDSNQSFAELCAPHLTSGRLTVDDYTGIANGGGTWPEKYAQVMSLVQKTK